MRILLVYGTTTGQTRKICDFLAHRLGEQAHRVELFDVDQPSGEPDLTAYDTVVVAAPVRMGKYRKSVVEFAARHKHALQARSAVMLSVSMGAANRMHPDEAHAEIAKWDAGFVLATGWQPAEIHHVAGALSYTKYDFVTRWIMKRIARSEGNATDTSVDHEYTDWADLARFAEHIAAAAGTPPADAPLAEAA